MVTNCELCHEPYVLIQQITINDDMVETKYCCEKCKIIRFLWTEPKKDIII